MSSITPESADIMRFLGMSAAELDIPSRYSMFEEVVNYFKNFSDGKQTILKILGKTAARDSLESVWRYVRLENEKLEAIKSLDPEVFEDDISDELKQGILTMEKMDRIEKDIVRFEKPPEIDNSEIQDALNQTEHKTVIKVKNPAYSTEGVLGVDTQKIRDTLSEVKKINKELEYYG